MSAEQLIGDLLLVVEEYRLKELRLYRVIAGTNPEMIDLIELQKIARPGAGISTHLIDKIKLEPHFDKESS